MAIIKVSKEATLTEADGTDTTLFSLEITSSGVFPSANQIVIGGTTWLLECYVTPGRYGDKLITHILKLGDDGQFRPVLDYNITTGVEIIIDNVIRIYGIDIQPDLRDNYDNTKTQGTYFIGISEVQ